MARISRHKIKNIISVLLVVALLIAGIGVLSSFASKKVETLSVRSFSRGALNTSGKFVDSKKAIYTEEAFGCQGLVIEPSFEFIGTYDVYYYDYDGKFIEAKRGLEGCYNEDYPLAKLARVVIYPELEDGDDKIAWYSVLSVARMFKITVNKDQIWQYDTANLYNDNKATYDCNFYMGQNGDDVQNDVGDVYLPLVNFDGCKVSEEIKLVEGCTKYDIYYRFTEWVDMYTFNVVSTSNGKILESIVEHSLKAEVGQWMKVTIEVPSDTSADHLRVRMANCAECYIFGYN